MADLPAGTSFGTLVHAVLETTDPTAADLPAELRLRCAEQLARHGRPVSPPTQLAGRAAAGAAPPRSARSPTASRCGTSPVRDRLAELDFEIPLGGDGGRSGDSAVDLRAAPTGTSRWAISAVLRRHCPPTTRSPGTPSGWLAGMSRQPLRGYLTGSLDACSGCPGRGTWSPTTRPTGSATSTDCGAALSAWHYRPEALDEVMAGSDYPLQAMLYCVALHRFLRWRQPGYDPERQSAVCCTCSSADVRRRQPGGGRPAVRGVRLAATRPSWSSSCRNCSMRTGGVMTDDRSADGR